ncbi:ubiquitin-binding protein NDAI_0B05540 [Naumovozyma dairenensis CBS 421]|uniref:VHS domain-containing protein n=1 Tax=Naumovozyma dairenensis (strain ATCC 10597 / BCRC 20456 / CBS 421 / NBRC 0211 / NRRL Y-12639) TaxID=1071378 RepID=G0W726_NAUDC|nr:hypothetical protein NDAI_0B05540 [Naumovozyma dairenensis CBS 421]CCD23587.1 hypothetical protein NDAI_0B05540 [Naumovozyma dairenensis CBS 421]
MSSGIYLSDTPIRRAQASGSPLLRKIQRACRMSLPEPDLALNLDVADYINEKQGAAPRDAAIAIVNLINNRDVHTAIFALALLDVLVKNCGYPFHLQISRKEFLNELVKRFPEHPPMRYSKVHRLVLTAIEEWYQTICKHSSYKEDLGYIRDMRRLLKYKGYAFPKIQAEDLAVMRETDQLKTPSEIQKEQEIAQAAKLEELIRRGKPEDLREANKLMKIMAGFKEDNARNAKQTIQTELNKLKRKADLFNEMMSTSASPDVSNETIEELFSALKGAQPKFQKIIEEEHDDDALVQDLLKFNDTVNQLLEKYSLLKIGNSSAASQIHPVAISNTASDQQTNSGALAHEINLLDFGDDNDNATNSGSPAVQTNAINNNTNSAPVDDLLGDLNDLTISTPAPSQNFGVGGSISLGGPSQPTTSTTPANANSLDLLGELSTTTSNTTTTTNNANANSLDLFGDSTTISQQAQSTRILVHQSSTVKIEFELSRETNTTIKLKSYFSNTSTSNLTQLTFLVAIPKSMKLRLLPQSTNELPPLVQNGITQEAWVDNFDVSSVKPLKIKWKLNYMKSGCPAEETAVFTLPKV